MCWRRLDYCVDSAPHCRCRSGLRPSFCLKAVGRSAESGKWSSDNGRPPLVPGEVSGRYCLRIIGVAWSLRPRLRLPGAPRSFHLRYVSENDGCEINWLTITSKRTRPIGSISKTRTLGANRMPLRRLREMHRASYLCRTGMLQMRRPCWARRGFD